jgi:[ribosomal protein S18]-alanine N-acetyltransferase
LPTPRKDAAKLSRATLKDLDEVHIMEKTIFRKDAFSRRKFRCLLTESNALALKDVMNGRIVGFVAGEVKQVSGLRVGVIQTLEVLPRLRQQGLGTKLILSILSRFKVRGATLVILQVRPNNYKARRLYMKLGFTKRRIIPNFYGPNQSGLELQKPIPRE